MSGRCVVLAVVLAAGTAGGTGCGKDAAPAVKVVPGQRAGIVREAVGSVTATRGGAARTLVAGDEVSGDDEIQTGADGSVLIELDHNHVTFTLPAGKTQRVAASLAWRQPIATAAVATTDEHSAAAGRPIERSAVDTAASSNRPSAAEAPGAAEAVVAEGEKSETTKTKRGGEQAADRKETERDDGGGGTLQAPRVPPPPPALDPTTGARDADKESRDPPKPGAGPSLAIEVAGGLTIAEVAAKITVADLAGCWRDPPASTTITLAVHSAGRIEKVTSSDAAAEPCLVKQLATVTFAPRRAGTTVTLTLGR